MDTPAPREFTMYLPLADGSLGRASGVMPPKVVAGLEQLPGGDPDVAWRAVARFALTMRARGDAAVSTDT